MSNRNQSFYLVSGTSGSGKSTFVAYLISIYHSLNPQRNILVMNPQQEKQWSEWGFKWTKIGDMYKERNNKLWQNALKKQIEIDSKGKKKLENNTDLCTRIFSKISFTFTKKRFKGLLVCDDASSYISNFQKLEVISDLISMRGQNDMDMIYIYHGLNLVPKYILNSADGTNILFYNSAIDESMRVDKANTHTFNAQMVVNYLSVSGNKNVYARVNNLTKKITYEKVNLINGEIDTKKPLLILNKDEILQNYFSYVKVPKEKRHLY